jgi:hypothetical protein
MTSKTGTTDQERIFRSCLFLAFYKALEEV